MKIKLYGCVLLLLFSAACKDLDTINPNNPDRKTVLRSSADLAPVLQGAYLAWWQGVHNDHPVIALSIGADAYSMSWGNFGAQRFGEEPRSAYNNRSNEDPDYKQVVEAPWFGCLSAVSSANDVLAALQRGVSLDQGGPQDQSMKAAAHMLRGLSWGYLGLLFDQALIAKEETNVEQEIPFSTYQEMIIAAESELDTAIKLAQLAGVDFVHDYFNGVTLGANGFVRLCHAYAARFLAQAARTAEENDSAPWQRILAHAEQGIQENFAPLADGRFWSSYHKYVFAETGQGPFWARVDQRLIAALDSSQPSRYPEVFAQREAPLTNPRATSADARLASDFVFLPTNNFPTERGEWHFSHYKHNRNKTDPSFAGDGSSNGPMPAFRVADNELLRAEALLRLRRKAEAVAVINAGTRLSRGNLLPLSASAPDATVLRAIWYERAIELLSTAPMGLWFDRRRVGPRLDYRQLDDLGGLQIGTPAQLPVPADEMRIRMQEPYNFGGSKDPNGIVRTF
jgi:hypothetical protein